MISRVGRPQLLHFFCPLFTEVGHSSFGLSLFHSWPPFFSFCIHYRRGVTARGRKTQINFQISTEAATFTDEILRCDFRADWSRLSKCQLVKFALVWSDPRSNEQSSKGSAALHHLHDLLISDLIRWTPNVTCSLARAPNCDALGATRSGLLRRKSDA